MHTSLIGRLFHLIKHWAEYYRFLFLFIMMMAFFIIQALVPSSYFGYITSLCFFTLVIYSIYIIGLGHRSLWYIGLLIGAFAIAFLCISLVWTGFGFSLMAIIFAAMYHALMVYACLYYSLDDDTISITSLFGSLCAYLFIGLFFSSIFILIYHLNHQAFTGLSQDVTDDFVYYSFVTLTTLGYGDIWPITKLAKVLSWIEAYIGQAYLTLLMALMVGRYLNQRKKHQNAAK